MYIVKSPYGSPCDSFTYSNITLVNSFTALVHSGPHSPELPALSRFSRGDTSFLYWGMKGDAHRSLPNIFCSPLRLSGGLGSAQLLINLVASRYPSGINWYPNTTTSGTKNLHFLSPSIKPAFTRTCITFLVSSHSCCHRCCCPGIVTSSKKALAPAT